MARLGGCSITLLAALMAEGHACVSLRAAPPPSPSVVEGAVAARIAVRVSAPRPAIARAGAVPEAAAIAPTGADVQARMSADASAGAPIVVHVIVALCDNEHQGIVPVPKALGNGRDPASNLYWGARFGVRAYFSREAGWKTREVSRPADGRILERAVFFERIERSGRLVPVYVVADAWDGAEIKAAIGRFLEIAAGRSIEEVRAGKSADAVALCAGGGAHAAAFIGHDGLMD